MISRSHLLPSNPVQFHAVTRGTLIYLLAFTAITVMGFPLLWMILCSLKEPAELYQAPPDFLPVSITFRNYTDLFTQTGFARYFANSLIVASATTFLSLVLGALGGYTLNRFRFLGLAAIAGLSMLCYMLPETLVVIPVYMLVSLVGLQDTLVSLIAANTAFTLPFALWFMRSYFRSIPTSFEESAMLEGCTRFKAFRKVTLPLALPGLISVGVFSFNNAWNEFLFALILTSSERNKTLPLGLSTWIGQDSIYSWGMLLASSVLLTTFSIVLYMLTQKKLTSGLVDGGMKG